MSATSVRVVVNAYEGKADMVYVWSMSERFVSGVSAK